MRKTFVLVYLFKKIICFLFPDGVSLYSDLHRKVFTNGTLLITNVVKDLAEGVYQCTAKNRQGFQSSDSTKLKVIGKDKKCFCLFLNRYARRFGVGYNIFV